VKAVVHDDGKFKKSEVVCTARLLAFVSEMQHQRLDWAVGNQ